MRVLIQRKIVPIVIGQGESSVQPVMENLPIGIVPIVTVKRGICMNAPVVMARERLSVLIAMVKLRLSAENAMGRDSLYARIARELAR